MSLAYQITHAWVHQIWGKATARYDESMAYTFHLHKESLRRKFSVYVVLAKSDLDTQLYVGKTGDNRLGCNPLISRCGNHFSYNDIHSQVRNKIPNHEERDYTYVFEHFDDYPEDDGLRRICIDRINEMERWVNQEVAKLVAPRLGVRLMNEYFGRGYLPAAEQMKRTGFRSADCATRVTALVSAVEGELDRRRP